MSLSRYRPARKEAKASDRRSKLRKETVGTVLFLSIEMATVKRCHSSRGPLVTGISRSPTDSACVYVRLSRAVMADGERKECRELCVRREKGGPMGEKGKKRKEENGKDIGESAVADDWPVFFGRFIEVPEPEDDDGPVKRK